MYCEAAVVRNCLEALLWRQITEPLMLLEFPPHVDRRNVEVAEHRTTLALALALPLPLGQPSALRDCRGAHLCIQPLLLGPSEMEKKDQWLGGRRIGV